jgi:hypothetical protein
MSSERRQGIAARLQELYRADGTARTLFDDAAARSYSVARTSVDRIARIAGTTRATAVDLCKRLDEIGVGSYKRAYTKDGDRFPARIHWHYAPRSIGRVAKGETDELLDLRLEDADDDVEQRGAINGSSTRQRRPRDFIEHRFPLREGRIAILELPMDLTRAEAERLATFIAALAQPD